MHRVKTYGGEERRRSSLHSDAQQQQKPRPTHFTDEEQLSMWLEKIRRRKAYRSPFSALVPGCGESDSSPSITVEMEEVEDDAEVEDEENPPMATPSYYVDASSTTPSRILNFILPGDGSTTSPGDPFKSPVSVVRGRGEGRPVERRTMRDAWLMDDLQE